MSDFKEWPGIPRLYSKCTITEKADGKNMCIVINKLDSGGTNISVQSRTQLLSNDNDQWGMLNWAANRAESLVKDLGEGHHFGEFMTKGFPAPRFYLFNTRRWTNVEFATPQLHVVPVLFEGDFYTELPDEIIAELEINGSRIHPGIPAEGAVLFYHRDESMKKFYCRGGKKRCV